MTYRQPVRKSFCVLAVLLAFSIGVQAAGPDYTFFLKFPLYLHTPYAFADRRIGFLPADPHVPTPIGTYDLWYLHVPGYTMPEDWARLRSVVQERKVPGLDFSGERNILTLNDIEPLHNLRLLNLSGTRVNPGELISLAWMQDLEVVILNDRTTDDGLDRIGRHTKLVELGLSGTQVTNEGLKVIPSRFPYLQRIDLSNTQITDDGLKNLAGLPLQQIVLPAGITGKGLETISAIRTLQQIDLSQTHVNDEGITSLAKLTKVHTLFVSREMTDTGLESLSHMTSLRRLDLTGSHVTDKGVQTIQHLKGLEELALSQTAVTDAAAESLLPLKHLRYLEISDTGVTDAGLKRLAKIRSLNVISFTTKGSLDPERFKDWRKIPYLQRVIINGYPMRYEWMQQMRGDSPRKKTSKTPIANAVTWLEGRERFSLVSEADAALLPSGWIHLVDDAPAATGELSPAPLQDKSVSGVQLAGLKRIHYVQSELDDVVPAPSTINQDNQQNTQKNFLGDFSVGVQGKSKDAPSPIPDQP